MKDWISQLLDLVIVFCFDNSAFKRHRSAEESADTILWLATTHDSNEKFWFDRKQAKTTILNLNKSSEEDESLWKLDEA